MALLPVTAGFLLLAIVAFCASSKFYITPDNETSCDHKPCLTLDQFASENISNSSATYLIPGHHNLTKTIEIVGVDNFSILANTSVTIQCTPPASFLFEDISNLEIRNTAIVSCGGGNSSDALQIRSVQQFIISNVTLQESASVALNVQDSNGLVTEARFIGNTGAGMNITNSTVYFEGNNTFSDNLDGGIASYNCSTLQFSGVNQFKNNTATNGGGISAISSTINCSGNMTFEYNSAEQYGGGVYVSGTRMTSEGHIMFLSNTVNAWHHRNISIGGAGLFAAHNSLLDLSSTISFINNYIALSYCSNSDICGQGGGIYATSSTVFISGSSIFMNNSAQLGGGVYVVNTATVNISETSNFVNNSAAAGSGGGVYASNGTVNLIGTSNFTNNSAEDGGGICAEDYATVNIRGNSSFIDNSARDEGGGVYADNYATVSIRGTSNFTGNSAQEDGGGICAENATVSIIGTSNFIDNSAQDEGGGVCADDYATVNISGTSNFIGNSAQEDGGGVIAEDYATVNISGTSNFICNSAQDEGGGVCADDYATVNIWGKSNFTGNSAQEDGGGVIAEDYATVNIIGTSNFIDNSAQDEGGGVCADDYATVNISGSSKFIGNSAQRGGGISLHQSAMYVSGDSSFIRNSASARGGGIYIETSSETSINGNITFSDNWSQYGGGISMVQSEIMLQGNTAFSNNNASYGGSIQAFQTKINVTGNGGFTKNLATVNGGALALVGGSVVYIFETAFLTFDENIADCFGGAIYIEDNSVHCSYDWNNIGFLGFYNSAKRSLYECCDEHCCNEANYNLSLCFAQFLSYKINISFSGNSAKAGSAIFGGDIDKTLSNIKFRPNCDTDDILLVKIGDLFNYLFNVSIDATNNGSTISSNPNRICRCINGQPDFSDPPSPYEVSVYPGQTVGVSLVAVGQRNGTVPSTTTFAQYEPDDGATFRDLQSTQRIDQTTCTELHYTIFSRNDTETLKIYVDDSCGLEGTPLSVNVILLECPIGFTLSNSSNQCVCEERLQNYTSNCNISNLEITRTASDDFWVGVVNTDGTEGLILHPHCPFDYCTTDTVHFTLNDTNTSVTVLNGNSNATVNDAQCNYNRSGLLCGKCQKGFSLVFGSSKCLKYSNSYTYLSLLIAFALAGVILIIFLLMLKLTVAVGTINGLIFYANIVSVNRAQLFPSGETNILTVFIAWVNLDLGIETCFFDGMDAYSKAWLQYAFPVYVWVLAGAVILGSRHSTRIARYLGTNPVAVLATLFILSYAKLLRSIINPLYVTFLDYPSYTKAVWLVDGNVNYLKGKHIPIFLTSLLALFLLFIPFTLLLLLGQWIQAQSERKCCSWISDYRISTFLDVYHGPFKNKHRYWCGLLLVARLCLFLVFAFNIKGDPSVNILATTICLIGLLVVFLLFTVYKACYLNVLEASFIINLLLLSIGTNYVDVTSGRNQNALTYASVSVSFATFCGIVVYHSCLQIKDSTLFKKLIAKLTHSLKPSAHDNVAEEGCYRIMNEEEEDPPRKNSKPPSTSVVEISHFSITSVV